MNWIFCQVPSFKFPALPEKLERERAVIYLQVGFELRWRSLLPLLLYASRKALRWGMIAICPLFCQRLLLSLLIIVHHLYLERQLLFASPRDPYVDTNLVFSWYICSRKIGTNVYFDKQHLPWSHHRASPQYSMMTSNLGLDSNLAGDGDWLCWEISKISKQKKKILNDSMKNSICCKEDWEACTAHSRVFVVAGSAQFCFMHW